MENTQGRSLDTLKFPEKLPDPGRDLRIGAYLELLRSGVPREKLMLHKRFEVSNDQMLWDAEDADAMYRTELMAFGAKDLSVKAHIQERIEISQKAKKNGELNIALDAIKDVAKLQNLYDETLHTDNKIEFVFKYELPEISKVPVVDVIPEKINDKNSI